MTEFHFHDFIKNYDATNFLVGESYRLDPLIDLKTGINYLFAYGYAYNSDHQWDKQSGYGWGYGYGYGGLTPRLKPDGTPYVSSLDEIKKACVQFIRNVQNLDDGKYDFHLADGLYQIILEKGKFRTTINADKPVE